MPEFLSPSQFGALAGLSLATVRRYLASGQLPKVQPGGKRCRVLIPRAALTAAVTAEPAQPSTPELPRDRNRHVGSGAAPRWTRSHSRKQ